MEKLMLRQEQALNYILEVNFMVDRAGNIISQSYIYSLGQDGTILNKRSQTGKSIEALNNTTFLETLRNIEVIDLAEKYAQQEAEAAENPNKYPDIDLEEIKNYEIADLSKRVAYQPTGDPKQDKILELTTNYRKSCFDFTHASEFDKLTEEMDLTGMTNEEKYKAIYEKYQYCYGENFADVAAVCYVVMSADDNPCMHIFGEFFDEVNKACGGEAAAQKARIEALDGEGLKASEVRQMIIDEYYYDGMTLRDLLKMTNEMNLCGLDGGARNLLDPILNLRMYFDNEPLDQYTQFMNRESILDEPVSKEFMRKFEHSASCLISASPDLPGVVGMLMDLFKVNEIEGGINADNSAFANVWDKFK